MRRFGAGLLVVVLAASCTSAPPSRPSISPEPGGIGGTLRLGTAIALNLDPQRSYRNNTHAAELFRCCLLRTLLSYNGLAAADGGGVVSPDLAERMPEVSQDRLTWTFHLRPELRYAPPLEDVPIVAADVIRGLEREARVGGGAYAFYFDVIDGFEEFETGAADSIRGLQAPDDRTVVVHLTRPTGDFGDRVALAGAAPIPPDPTSPSEPLGAAEGHDRDYGSYLVASGPYMPESIPIFARAGSAAKGGVLLEPGESIALVRNPSWSRSSDPLRLALADRIEIHFFASQRDVEAAIRSGAVDLELGMLSSSAEAIEATSADGSTLRAFVGPSEQVVFLTMNLAVPPLDDLSVRRAVNLIVDRDRLVHLFQTAVVDPGFPPLRGAAATHLIPDAIEGDLLSTYDPYERGPDELPAARAEMARSRYDTDHDGVCDASACWGVPALVLSTPLFRRVMTAIREDLEIIGIHLELREETVDAGRELMADPRSRLGFPSPVARSPDYANASTFFVPLFRHPTARNNRDLSMVGAGAAQLRRWGYDVLEVPSITSRIDACDRIIGDAQARCWALLDRYLMERLAPIVPLFASTRTVVVGPRVDDVVFDAAAAGQIALDRLRVTPEASVKTS